jgi:acetolactate synthase-1/2/3 large subunit
MHGGDLVADVLVRRGVRTLFTLVGGHISPVLVSAKARGMSVLDVREEATAAFAADAVSRLSPVPGVAVVTAGPGVTNVITALKNAQLAQSPLVLIGGATATILRGRGSLQDIDQMAVVRPHVKWAVAVKRVRDLVPSLARAFDECVSGVPGPVFVECPLDLLYPEAMVREMYFAGQREPATLGERAVRWYLERHLARVFDVSGPTIEPPPRPFARRGSVDAAVASVRSHLAGAERPVIVIGSQAIRVGTDTNALASAVSALGVPVFLSGMARGLLGASHPLQFRHQRKQALKQADVVVLAGTPSDFRLDYGRQVSRKATLVGVNLDRRDLTKNRRPTVAVRAAPDDFLIRLAGSGATRRAPGPWLDTLRAREAEREADITARSALPIAPLNPISLCRAIDEALPDNAVIVADGGDFVATASYILRPRSPRSWLDPGVFGTLGVGAGFVLGVHAARPEAEIWAIYGDGALGFSLAEFDTFVRNRVPVIAVVGNDGKWAQIARDQVPMLGDDVATVLGRAAYHRVVEGFGAKGFLLDDPARVAETLAEARGYARQGVPVLVNAHIGDTDFRKGSISL